MNVRSRKPAAGIVSASTSRNELSTARYISTSSTRYGTSEVATSSRLRPNAAERKEREHLARKGARRSSLELDLEPDAGAMRPAPAPPTSGDPIDKHDSPAAGIVPARARANPREVAARVDDLYAYALHI
jgi:hypothetical protein